MAKKVVSAKGEVVDFDLLAIKNKMANKPRTEDVVKREVYVDKKRRRSSKRIKSLLDEQERRKNQKTNDKPEDNVTVEDMINSSDSVEKVNQSTEKKESKTSKTTKKKINKVKNK